MKDKTIVAGLYNNKKVVFYDYSFKKLKKIILIKKVILHVSVK